MSYLPDLDDWNVHAQRALEDFRTLLRFRSINPPGNEGPAADFVASRLKEAGIETTVVHSEDRPNVIGRIRGDGTGGGPILLASHLDEIGRASCRERV